MNGQRQLKEMGMIKKEDAERQGKQQEQNEVKTTRSQREYRMKNKQKLCESTHSNKKRLFH